MCENIELKQREKQQRKRDIRNKNGRESKKKKNPPTIVLYLEQIVSVQQLF